MTACFSDPVCWGMETVVVARSQINHSKIQTISFSENLAISMSHESHFPSNFPNIVRHHFFRIFAFVRRQRGIVGVMFFCFLFFVVTEKLVQGVTDSVEFGELSIVIRWGFIVTFELDLLGFIGVCRRALSANESIEGVCKSLDLFNPSPFDFAKVQHCAVRRRYLQLALT